MTLRDFNSADDRPITLQNQPLGNGTGLNSFHTVHPEDSGTTNTPKIVGAVAVALMIGAAGIALYAHSSSSMQPKPIMAASNLPAPPPAAPISAPVPAPDQSAQATKAANAATTDPNSLRAAEARTPAPASLRAAAKSAPIRSASMARNHIATSSDSAAARTTAGANGSVQPQQQAVIPEPVSPAAPPSSLATTNTQSGVAVPQGAATASDIPSNAAPAQDQQSSTPAPAQPPAQSAGQVSQ